MKKYRYYLLAAFICIVVTIGACYQFGIMQSEHTVWIGLILSPIITLTAIAFTNFEQHDQNARYTQQQYNSVKTASATPIPLIKSPILWLGLISLAVIAGFVLI